MILKVYNRWSLADSWKTIDGRIVQLILFDGDYSILMVDNFPT